MQFPRFERGCEKYPLQYLPGKAGRILKSFFEMVLYKFSLTLPGNIAISNKSCLAALAVLFANPRPTPRCRIV